MITGKQAWAWLAGGILVYEVLCDENELLSVVCDGWIEKRPLLARAVIVGAGTLITAHVSNVVPEEFDVISRGFSLWRKARRKSTR